MMHLDPICTTLRLAPIVALFAVHCSDGRWPSDGDCAKRVLRYGFSVERFRERPASVLTHLFVHISSRHFISNVLYLASTLIEFGDVMDAATDGVAARLWGDSPDEQGRRLSGSAGERPTTQRMESGMRVTWGERGFLLACVRSVGAFFVWTVGGVAGGPLSQMLYNNITLALRRKRAARAAAAAAFSGVTDKVEGGVGSQILRSLLQGVRALRHRVEAWNSDLAVSAQEAVNKSMVMCGASAGVCALSGFSAVYYGRPFTACCLVLPEVVRLAADLINCYIALLAPGLGSTDSTAEAERRAVQSAWRILRPGQTVGHAAHIGGFVVGMGMGCGWLWVQRQRGLRHSQRRRRTAW
ncbi:hypothetical protein JKF63_07584 [Porcisia hertigi]|uniref:Rhomboid protein n=1 Tax=Porcisia hertigi TaxID=2761500 RepID=A0A836LMA4_9TRYP|nr:hypothetical protein JKF63_07584 [Porcisia hertigi]